MKVFRGPAFVGGGGQVRRAEVEADLRGETLQARRGRHGTAATMLLFGQQHRCHGLREDFLKCPRALNAVMATDGFEGLVKSCPALLKDLISKLAAR